MIWFGAAIMIATEAATLAGVEPFASWNTPIAWTGFIIFADAVVYRARGESWLGTAPREFACIALLSIPLWLVFEAYNLVIHNWSYIGLPENFWLRQFGYAWSFATIWPAIFEAAELAAVGTHRINSTLSALPGRPAPPASSALSALGAAMLLVPFFVSPAIARYLAAPVWLGFIFLLDPINARLGAERLTSERIVNLSLGGLLCGILWEFWNYRSRTKWIYTVPIMEHTKLFEMPLPGYLGFPAFALECFTMYVFVRAIFGKLGRRVAL